MGKIGTKLPSFCLNRVTTHFRVRSPPITNQKNDFSDNGEKISGDEAKTGVKTGPVLGRRIMIVVDSSFEAKGAIQWALTHTVQNQDTIILLYVTKPSKQGEQPNTEMYPREYELLSSMKNMCHVKRPEVQIEVAVVEGKEKGPTIVAEAKKQGVSLLILGQKKRSMTWRLVMMWAGNRIGGGVVEYCIENASCMTIGVRRKSRKLGGYLITTKRHKDFWLLA
ncbi:UspA [Macleaya cordata]|uniref:UspA n=1 Tax=Macleaya cordata TaxID=56857 RepID=A0A200QKL3_MACCD|nr:UspA [Macleaya cordata]